MGKSRINRWWSPSELETEIRSGTWAKRFYLWRLLSSCRAPLSSGQRSRRIHRIQISLYKILFPFKALLSESIILLLPPPAAKPTLLQHYCTTIAQYTPPPTQHPFAAIPYSILVMAISCKGQNTDGSYTKSIRAHTQKQLIRGGARVSEWWSGGNVGLLCSTLVVAKSGSICIAVVSVSGGVIVLTTTYMSLDLPCVCVRVCVWLY